MLVLSNGSRYDHGPDWTRSIDANGRQTEQSAEHWPTLLAQLAAWPDATPHDRHRIHTAAKMHAVGQESAHHVYITSHTIIGTPTRVYAAWLKLTAPAMYGRHGVVSSLGTGSHWAQLGSEDAPDWITRLPAMSAERRAAAQADRERRYTAARAVILTSRHRQRRSRRPR